MIFDLESGIAVLQRTPGTVRALLDGLPDPWVRGTEGPQTFSAFDNVGHLIDGEETDWIPRAQIILSRGPDPQFEPYDRFRHWQRNKGRSLDALLDEFGDLREQNLELLRSWQLTDEQLDLPGLHPSLGRVTLRHLLAAWVVHDLGHIAQISRVMAKQYRDEVGPWVPFMPVLTDHEVPRSCQPRMLAAARRGAN
ncbi:MAG: DinB family protein [Gemmatimonadaceae bacterium]